MTTTRSGAARAIADLTQGTILASVDIAAPIERVFQALTDPKEIVRWWGSPDAYQTTDWESDLRKGGRFRAGGKMPDGSRFALTGEYLVVDPPHTLVHTWEPDWVDGERTTVRIQLESIDGGARVTLRHDGFEGRRDACASHATGWQAVLGWLAGFTAPVEQAAPSVFMCKLLPPRPTFPADMTDAERQVMQDHVVYWRGLLERGTAVAFGPVMDPNGAWGAGIVTVREPSELAAIEAGDPAIRSGLGFRYQLCAMPNAIVRP
jgi:uncharacterized protein YndB with AHSA1/START domain